jgi:hypothetical protein
MPPQLDADQTIQLSAMAGSTDGTTRDVTTETQWQSFDLAVATISGSGLLKGLAPGKTAIQATYGGRKASAEVLVLTSGTFILQGSIFEVGNLPLAGARVEVLDGPQAGRVVQMPLQLNSYEIYGLSGDVRVRATRDGYFAETKTAGMSANRRLDFELRPTTPLAALSGTYRLSVTASNACAAQLRPDLRARVYNAVVRQEGPRLAVTLLGPQFVVGRDARGNGFSGTTQGNTASFSLGGAAPFYGSYYYYYYYSPSAFDVVELVPQAGWSPGQPGTVSLTINGTVTATITASGIAGSLDGSLIQWQSNRGFYSGQAFCRAPDHQFVLTRQ